ncbi:MAG: AIR synthase related protein [Micromonosporaceae bacterium]
MDVTAPREAVPDSAEALDDLVEAVRAHPGLRGKASIGLVSQVLGDTDWIAGPGDDGAVVEVAGGHLVTCGEALLPPFVAADPFGAGIAAVVTNVNDLAAMGAVPLGIIDTVVADEERARVALEGMSYASRLYQVPILGGHLTAYQGQPALSAFAFGVAPRPLSVTRVAVGQSLMMVCCLEGRMREDFPFFPSFEARGERVAGDIRVFAEVARSGVGVAAKDISMAGLVGSVGMLLEWGGFGVTIDVARLPRPAGVPLSTWLTCFPSFGFLLCSPPGREEECAHPFLTRGLVAEAVGRVDDTGEVALRSGSLRRVVLDLRGDGVTRLGGRRSGSAVRSTLPR